LTNKDFAFTLGSCNSTFFDPTTFIIQSLNEIMFRTALLAANVSLYAKITGFYTDETFVPLPDNDGVPRNRTITMVQTSNINVFQSDYKFLGAAVAILLLGVLLIIPLYHGYELRLQ